MGLEFAEIERGDPARTRVSTPEIEEILLLHHSHLDVGYTHSQPVLWELQSEFISQALNWLEKTHDLPEGHRPKWTCEATEPVRRWLARASATDTERFAALHRQADGRGAFVSRHHLNR